MSDAREDAINTELDAVYRKCKERIGDANRTYDAAVAPFLRAFRHEADAAHREEAVATKAILVKYGLPLGEYGRVKR